MLPDNDIYYKMIKKVYGNRCAKRSGVPLINHINEGMIILEAIGADTISKQAFCLHPIVQNDIDLLSNIDMFSVDVNFYVAILAMEYRDVANEYLSQHYVNTHDAIRLSSIEHVNHMLIADKVQNRKDFELYHKGKHLKSDILDSYFKNWLRVLNISEDKYLKLCETISRG